MCNQEWTIQRLWQHWAHKTQDEDKHNKNRKLERWAMLTPLITRGEWRMESSSYFL